MSSALLSPPCERSAQQVVDEELRATVYLDAVPAGLAEELPELYSSLFCTNSWFRIYDDTQASGACLLDDPRHVLLFHVVDDTIEVLNKVFAISPADAERACRALFRAFPRARRIHLEVMFPPAELHQPKRVLYFTDHLVIDLPSGADGYVASLGKHTRKNLQAYEKRLRRDFDAVTFTEIRDGERAGELFDQFLGWKTDRIAPRGETTSWEQDPARVARFVELVRETGEAVIASAGGATIAVWFVFYVGSTCFSRAGSFDPRFEPYALGSLMHYWVAQSAAARGARSVHLGWTAHEYMKRFGAQTTRVTRLSVFRSQLSRVHSAGEAADVARRRARLARRYYWRARRAARRLATAALRRVRPQREPR
jgi:CelD/BcsL family acetyltransferase involved in cellulose biosynthesis